MKAFRRGQADVQRRLRLLRSKPCSSLSEQQRTINSLKKLMAKQTMKFNIIFLQVHKK